MFTNLNIPVLINFSSNEEKVSGSIIAEQRNNTVYVQLEAFCNLIVAALINDENNTASKMMPAVVYGSKKASLSFHSDTFTLDSPDIPEPVQMQCNGEFFLENDRVFAPIDFFDKAFGISITFDIANHVLKVDAERKYYVYNVSGIAGDGIEDDGPVIEAAITQAAQHGGYAVLILPQNKKLYIGEKTSRYAYFNLENIKNFSIEGNGSELVFSRKNSAFKVKNCENVAFRNLNIDYKEVPYAQGVVVSKNEADNSFDAEIENGFSLPPDNTFVAEQGWPWSSGAGLHGLVFNPTENGANAVRKYSLDPPYHFACRSIAKVQNSGNRTYRFTLANAAMFHYIDVNDKITYGLSHIYMTRQEYDAKLLTGYSETFDLLRNNNLLLEDINIYASLGMGIRISDHDGKVTLRRTNIRIKPGTNRLLATPSDGIHTKNNRVGITMDQCVVESTGDDNLNISTMFDYIDEIISDTRLKLRTVDVHIFFYRAKKGDTLMFFDLSNNTLMDEATIISEPIYDEFNHVTTVELSNRIEGIYAGSNSTSNPIRILNVNQRAKGTVIKNCTFRPVFRNSLFGNFDGGLIQNNKFYGNRGGIIGLNFCGDADVFNGSAHVLSYSNDINITGNEFHCYHWNAILQHSTPIKAADGNPLTRNINISDNYFEASDQNIAVFENIYHISGENNLISAKAPINESIATIHCTGTVSCGQYKNK